MNAKTMIPVDLYKDLFDDFLMERVYDPEKINQRKVRNDRYLHSLVEKAMHIFKIARIIEATDQEGVFKLTAPMLEITESDVLDGCAIFEIAIASGIIRGK